MNDEQKRRFGRNLSTALFASTALVSVTAAAEYVDYTVVKGDNLWDLAVTYNTTVGEIASRNQIGNTRLIYPNQRISIPVNTREAGVSPGQGMNGNYASSSNTSTNGGSSSSNSSSNTRYYQVKRGDTLSQIALNYGVTVSQLAQWNGIANIHLIYTGTYLIVGTGSSDMGGSSTTTGSTGTLASNQYSVVRGDNLWNLAIRFGTTVDQLVAWNNIANPNLIYVGEVLQVSSGSTSSSSGTSSNASSSTAGATTPEGTTPDTVAPTTPTVTPPTTPDTVTPDSVAPTTPDTVAPTTPDTGVTPDAGSTTTPDAVTPTTPDTVTPSSPDSSEGFVTPDINSGFTTPDINSGFVTPNLEEPQLPAPDSTPVTGNFSGDIMQNIEGLYGSLNSTVADTVSVEVAVEDSYEEYIEVDMGQAQVEQSSTMTMPSTMPSSPSMAGTMPGGAVMPTAAHTVEETQYEVKAQTTVFQVAALFNASVGDLLQWNDIEDSSAIPEGTVLQVRL